MSSDNMRNKEMTEESGNFNVSYFVLPFRYNGKGDNNGKKLTFNKEKTFYGFVESISNKADYYQVELKFGNDDKKEYRIFDMKDNLAFLIIRFSFGDVRKPNKKNKADIEETIKKNIEQYQNSVNDIKNRMKYEYKEKLELLGYTEVSTNLDFISKDFDDNQLINLNMIRHYYDVDDDDAISDMAENLKEMTGCIKKGAEPRFYGKGFMEELQKDGKKIEKQYDYRMFFDIQSLNIINNMNNSRGVSKPYKEDSFLESFVLLQYERLYFLKLRNDIIDSYSNDKKNIIQIQKRIMEYLIINSQSIVSADTSFQNYYKEYRDFLKLPEYTDDLNNLVNRLSEDISSDRENKINNVLYVLAALGVISAACDTMQIIETNPIVWLMIIVCFIVTPIIMRGKKK
ncbi:hypothetical protein SAMN02910369_00502 [Lachnospiraceae bacterium NE2001]|nr:hypothetical protein SAMN02910369_00502 [Lachnospiraceae bacterium NE2001]